MRSQLTGPLLGDRAASFALPEGSVERIENLSLSLPKEPSAIQLSFSPDRGQLREEGLTKTAKANRVGPSEPAESFDRSITIGRLKEEKGLGVSLAAVFHLIPSRTQKLSPPAAILVPRKLGVNLARCPLSSSTSCPRSCSPPHCRPGTSLLIPVISNSTSTTCSC